MAKICIYNRDKRVFFSYGQQRKFLLNIKKTLGLSWAKLSQLLDISDKTLTNWKKEEFSMPLNAVKFLCNKTKMKMPKNIKIRKPFWSVEKAAKAGGLAVYKKYGLVGGDPEKRRQCWYDWWQNEGKFIQRFPLIRKKVKLPSQSARLAEFIGIMLGDGCIASRQIHINFHSKEEQEYMEFVSKLIKQLFELNPGIYKYRNSNAMRLTVSRTKLIDYLLNLGMNKSNERKPKDIPYWIFDKRKYKIACLKGLIDTEGCFYIHTYKVNNKIYSYKKLCFSSHSKPLLRSVSKILTYLNFTPKITEKECVSLYNQKEVERYFKEIGTHNSKHIRRFNGEVPKSG